jgi:hypothetical protein
VFWEPERKSIMVRTSHASKAWWRWMLSNSMSSKSFHEKSCEFCHDALNESSDGWRFAKYRRGWTQWSYQGNSLSMARLTNHQRESRIETVMRLFPSSVSRFGQLCCPPRGFIPAMDACCNCPANIARTTSLATVTKPALCVEAAP